MDNTHRIGLVAAVLMMSAGALVYAARAHPALVPAGFRLCLSAFVDPWVYTVGLGYRF